MPNQPSFPIDPPILRQGGHYDFPSNTRPFSYNVHYTPVPETRRPSITVPTWYPASMAVDDGRLDASSLGEQGWRNRPHQAMDFGGGDGGSIWGEGPIVETPTSPASPEPSFEWNGSDSPFGEPIVETPTDQNPAPLPPDEPLFGDITNRDMTEPALSDNPNEWTTSPGDRRFLPGGGPDIRSFGNNLTLGEFLNTPLSTMRYGEGYPSVGGGEVRYAGTGYDVPGSEGFTPLDVSPDAERLGEIETQQLRDQGLLPADSEIPTGRPVSPDVRGAIPTGGGFPNFEGTRWDSTRGAYVPRDNATGAQFRDNNPHFGAGALTAMLQWSQGYGGAPNRTLVNDNERVFASAHGPNRPAPPRPPTGGG